MIYRDYVTQLAKMPHYARLKKQLEKLGNPQEAAAMIQKTYTALDKSRQIPPAFFDAMRDALPHIDDIFTDQPAALVRYELAKLGRLAYQPDDLWQLKVYIVADPDTENPVVSGWLHDDQLLTAAHDLEMYADSLIHVDRYTEIVDTLEPLLVDEFAGSLPDGLDLTALREQLDRARKRVHQTRSGWFTVRHAFTDCDQAHQLQISIRRAVHQDDVKTVNQNTQ